MSSLFRTLVAQYTQDLVNQLHQSDTFPEIPIQLRECSLESTPILDLTGMDANDGMVLCPEVGHSGPVDWCIFSFQAVDVSRGLEVYKLRERLSGASETAEFITEAHQALLQRPINLEGKMVFVRLIECGQITRRDLLNMLTRSSEARALDLRVIVIPSPSEWSVKIEMFGSEQPSFLVRIAR